MVQRSIRKSGFIVKRSGHRAAFVLAFFVMLLAAGAWLARPWLRERWYDYRDAERKAELPEAVPLSLRGSEATEAIPASEEIASSSPTAPPRNDIITIVTSSPTKPIVVAAVNLKIPFVSQAPHRNWSMPYQEACEEASAIMASLYYQGDTRAMVIGDAGDALLKKVIAWEEERFGYYKDTTVAETAVMLEEYFKLRVRIVDDPTVEDIKQAVADGKPVIVPAYGKTLPNPYFKNGGPLYHMLVVKGYTETKFITNDPGTNTRGAEFTYEYDALMNAIHDWNGGDVPRGAKRIIIVEGPAV